MKSVSKYAIGIVLLSLSFTIHSKAQSCSSGEIQAKLDTGKSLYTVIQECPSNATSDFTGKNYAGGVIAYVNGSRNGSGIIAATSDANTNSTWTSMWLGLDSFEALLPSGIGSGKSNTDRFCLSQGSQNNNSICGPSPKQKWQGGPNLYGFYFATQYQTDGYSDWYLPSKDELTTARTNSSSTFSSCPSGGWWSSTQVPMDYISIDNKGENVVAAFAMDASGNLSVVQKLEGRCVRAFRSFSPWIDNVSPSTVEEGMTITLTGSNFGTTPTDVEVQLPNGKKVTPQIANSKITFVLPSGVTSGNLRIVVNGIQSNLKPIVIAPKPPGVPTISSISKRLMIVQGNWQNERTMTIYGTNFSLVENTVTFSGSGNELEVKAHPTTSSTQINVDIPLSALTGVIHVKTSVGESHASSDTLFVMGFSMPAADLTYANLQDAAIDNTGNKIITVGTQNTGSQFSGNENTIIVSENGGVHWFAATTSNPTVSSLSLSSVEFSNISNTAIFTMFGTAGSTNYQMYGTPSSINNWNPVETNTNITSLFSTENSLLGVKDDTDLVYRSGFNGRQFAWTSAGSSGVTSVIKDLAADSSKIISVGDGSTAYWKADNSAKPEFTSNSQSIRLNSVIWVKNKFVGVGFQDSNSKHIYKSSDGETWSNATCDGGDCLYPERTVSSNSSIGMLITAGHALKTYYSLDGENWNTTQIPSSFTCSACNGGSHITQINKIIPINDGFVMVGEGGYIGLLKLKRPAH